jgi:8-amino-3,8-dideoxy-alpha-D-manno-octulosonate transaminase
MEIAKRRGIAVVEDAAQCVGGSYQGQRLGALGDLGIYSFQLCKMISSGEGGALVTNVAKIYERAIRYHDMGGVGSPFAGRLGGAQLNRFPGKNFRMSEFTGAVLDAQLPKLSGMIADLRRNAEYVRNGIKDLPGIRLRKQPDPRGDIGYGVYILLADRKARDKCIQGLRKRRIPAGTISGSVLLPIAPSIINKETQHPNWPSFTSSAGQAIEYGPECCQQTLDLYNRFVQVRMGPKYTQEQNDRIIDAIRTVYPQVS